MRTLASFPRRPARLIAVLGLVLAGGCAFDPVEGDLMGSVDVYRTDDEDTLIQLARDFDLGYIELAAANPGIDPWVPGDGTALVLPRAHLLPVGAREGMVINLAEQRLYYFQAESTPVTFPIGIGREGLDTPLGETEIVRRREGPTWTPTAAARADDPTLPPVVPAGPDNPLGTHALYLGWPTYLIHGTNEPYGIGRRVSRGCIRLYPEDIVALYDMVPDGTPVRVVNQPVKLGWSRGELYLEAHPTLVQGDQIESDGRFDREAEETLEVAARIIAEAGESIDRIDWATVNDAIAGRSGVPVRITRTPLEDFLRTGFGG